MGPVEHGSRRASRGSSTTSRRTGRSRGRRGQEPGEAEGDAGPLLGRGEEVPGAAARFDGGDPPHHAAARASRPAATCSPGPGRSPARPNGDAPSILNASYNFKAEVEIPQGGAEGMLDHPGRPLRRLRLLRAQGQAGLPLEPGGPEAASAGKAPRR